MVLNVSVPRIQIVRLTTELLNDPKSAAWAETRAQVMQGLKDHGCFEIIYDGITADLHESAMNAVKEAVALSLETKRKNVAVACTRGYIRKEDSCLPYESLAVDDVLRPGVATDFSNLMWPEGNKNFSDRIMKFSEAVAAVEKAVRKMMLEGLGVEKYFDFHMDFTKYLLRLSEYSPQGQNGDKMVTLPPHTDLTFTGLSLQSDVNGFEIKTKDGDWIEVFPSSRSSLIFIIGDLFRAWSNGRLYAPPHRVRVHEGQTRRVALLFAVPNGDPMIEVPPEFVDEEKNPVRFKPFRFMEYTEFFKTKMRGSAEDPAAVLPAFCGTGAP